MDKKVTLSKQKYEQLTRQAAAWRHVIGDSNSKTVFNAVRDNRGEGIEAGALAERLRALIEAGR